MKTIENHLLNYAEHIPSPNRGGTIDPKFIVLHYTASWGLNSVINRFSDSSSQVSAHVSVGTSAHVVQHVPFNKRAWHAGPSSHAGYTGLNNHSIGIEIVNIGWMIKVGNKLYRDHMGDVHKESNLPPLIKAKHAVVGSNTYYWPAYPDKQLDEVENVIKDLTEEYNIVDIVSHEEIDTRGWKTDPGPAFPMNQFKKLINPRKENFLNYEVTAPSLNVRSGPSTSFPVESGIAGGTVVKKLGQHGDWVRISDSGWVHGAYLRIT